MPESQPTYVRTPRVTARRVAGEMVLVPAAVRAADPNAKSARLYVLNETAERIWLLLDTARTAAELARNLTAEYDITGEQARADVVAFLESMLAIGAVERRGGS
jgi:hypothetical protein